MRLHPVMMTSLLGLAPIAFAQGIGMEVQRLLVVSSYSVSLAVGRLLIVTRNLIDEWRREGRKPCQAATQAIRDASVALASETNARAMNSKGQGEAG